MRKLVALLLLGLATGWLSAQTFTITGANITVQQGDAVPPLTYTWAGAATWATAVASGEPAKSTTYTTASAPGSYPITIAVGSLTAQSGYTFAYVAGSITVVARYSTKVGANTDNSPILPPSGSITNVKVTNGTCTGMAGDGVTLDDTPMDCWLHTGRISSGTYTRSPKQLYFPTGTYLLSATHQTYGCCTVLIGDGPQKSILKLAANSVGFSIASPATADSHFIYVAGRDNDEGFWFYVYNMGIEIGPGNTSARALVWQGNNSDAFRNVDVWFDDGGGNGSAGVYFNRASPGPSQFSNVRVFGGQYGVQASPSSPQYSISGEYITVENQSTAGVITSGPPMAIKGLFSSQSRAGVVAWSSVGATNNALYDAQLINGSSTNAISNSVATGTFTAHNVTQSGYTNAITDSNGSKVVAGTTLATGATDVYYSGTAKTLFSTASPQTVGIVPQDTPSPSDPPSGSWTRLPNTVSTWQAALNACTSTTYYVDVSTNYNQTTGLPDNTNIANYTGSYFNVSGDTTITVPDCVNHIYMNGAVLNPSTADIWWVVSGSSATPLIIEGQQGGQNGVLHAGSRKVVLKDQTSSYQCSDGAGDIFWDGTQFSYADQIIQSPVPWPTGPGKGYVTFCNGQKVFMRSGDNEARSNTQSVTNVALDNATGTPILTIQGVVEPHLAGPSGNYAGTMIQFNGLPTATWLNGLMGEILTTGSGTFTAKLYGTHADYPATPEAGGNYQVYYPKLACTGCTIWALGYKTERSGIQMLLTNARAEVWTAFTYNIGVPSVATMPSFRIINSGFMMTGYAYYGGSSGGMPMDWLIETRGASTLNYAMPGGTGGTANQFSQFFYSIGAAYRSEIKARGFKGKLQ